MTAGRRPVTEQIPGQTHPRSQPVLAAAVHGWFESGVQVSDSLKKCPRGSVLRQQKSIGYDLGGECPGAFDLLYPVSQ